MADIEIITNTKEAEKKLKQLSIDLNVNELGKQIGLSFVDWIDENFKSQGSKGGKKWKKLRPSTIAAKGSSAVLQDKGALKRSFGYEVKSTNNNVSVDVGSGLGNADGKRKPIASFHEYGTRANYPIVPKRKKALSFIVKKGKGGRIARKGVVHPRLPKRPMLPSKEKGNTLAKKTMEAYIKIVVNKINAKT